MSREEEDRSRLVLSLVKAAMPHLRKLLPGVNPRAMKRAVKRFEEHGHLFNMPRPGRPSKYTTAQMAAAVQMLVQQKQPLLTTPKLINQLRAVRILPSKVDTTTFASHLKAHVKQIGCHLTMNSTRTVPALVEGDATARVSYCKEMLAHLAEHPLGKVVFVDETTLQAAAHPKGAWLL